MVTVPCPLHAPGPVPDSEGGNECRGSSGELHLRPAAACEQLRRISDGPSVKYPMVSNLHRRRRSDLNGFPLQASSAQIDTLEQLNSVVKWHTDVAGIVANRAGVTRPVDAVLAEQNAEWITGPTLLQPEVDEHARSGSARGLRFWVG